MKLVRRAAVLAIAIACATALAGAAPAPPAKPAGKPAARPATPAASSRPSTPAAPPAPASDEALDAVAALVNDEAVLVSDVEEQLYQFLQQSGMRPDSTQVDTLRRQVLESLIDRKVLEGEAKKQAITVTDAEVARQVDQTIAQAKEQMGGEEAFREQLRRENLTEAALRERYRNDVRKEMMVEKLKRKQLPQRPVTQAEAEAYFLAHKDKFPRVPGEVRLQVIQIPPAPDSAAVAAGLAKIQAIRKRVTTGGEKFAKVASEVSEDPGSANAGGDLGFFSRGRMEKNVETAAFTQKPNEVGPPVRSMFGWHLVQVVERDTLKTAAGRDSLGEDGKPALEVHARHILVRVTPNEADVARAKAVAEHVRDEAKKGTPFGTLVRKYSKYDGPQDADGDVGFVSTANLQPSIRSGLDSLETGEVSDVLVNQTGFNVFRVVDRHPERDYTVDEIREELPRAVADAQYRERLDAYVKTLRQKAQIEYRNL